MHQESLQSITVSPWHAVLHAWQVEINGNMNSWGMMLKLLSKSSILRVQSTKPKETVV